MLHALKPDALPPGLMIRAVVDYARVWSSFDAPLIERIRDCGCKLEKNTLGAIAREYMVARGFKNDSLGELVHYLNLSSKDWPSTLTDRSQFCVDLAESVHRRGYSYNVQNSAITKFMWFLRPQNWTVFDKFAAEGMQITSPRNRMQLFYSALDKAGFDDVTAKLTDIIAASDWPTLPAPRILDAFLMRRGKRETATGADAALVGFLNALPPSACLSLIALASEVQAELGNEVLLP